MEIRYNGIPYSGVRHNGIWMYLASVDDDVREWVYDLYSKPRISRIPVERQIYAKIRLMRSEIKEFGTIVREI